MRKLQIAAIAVLCGLLLAAAVPTLAHETHTVGPYNLRVGWHVEPAYVGQMNAVELTVTQDSKPVEGIEKSLTVMVSTGDKTSDKLILVPYEDSSKEMAEMPGMQANASSTGVYLAALIPTRVGDYKFHFTGTIGTTQIDETFDSAGGKFACVEPLTELQFPDREPSNLDLQRQIDALKAEIAALKGAQAAPTAAR